MEPVFRTRALEKVYGEGAVAVHALRSAVFSTAEGEAVFVIEDDTVQLRPVVVGHSDGFLSEILSGLEEGEQVVRHPGNTLQPGAEVRLRL